MVDSRERLKSLRDNFTRLQFGDENELHRLTTRGDMLIKRVFGESSDYLVAFKNTTFFSGVHEVDESFERSIWEEGKSQMLNLLDTMLEDLELVPPDRAGSPAREPGHLPERLRHLPGSGSRSRYRSPRPPLRFARLPGLRGRALRRNRSARSDARYALDGEGERA
jgi:hypothetical protein